MAVTEQSFSHPERITWQSVQSRRIGKPPYRFTGCCLSDVSSPSGARITLWRRKKGDFAIAFTVYEQGAWVVDSILAPDLAAAMDSLERVCAEQTKAKRLSTPIFDLDVVTSCVALALEEAAAKQAFDCLAGHALDHWDMLAREGAMERKGCA